MRSSATAIVILSLWNCFANAAYDLSVGGTARSYPLSGVIAVETGYDQLVWGQAGGGNPFYGYLRPKLEADSALTYNSAMGSLDVFPVSFLGARVGGEGVQNDTSYSAYDCTRWECLGRYYRTFFETEITLGAYGAFIQGRWRRERWSEGQPTTKDFIEPTSGMSLSKGGESETVYYGVAGYKWSPELTVLGGVRYATSDEREYSRMPFGLIQYKLHPFTLAAGGGAFESALKRREATGLLMIRWEIFPSLELK